ncbi:MAG: hypothetical protein QNL21_04945, partial [Flavobacteriales bacterium]
MKKLLFSFLMVSVCFLGNSQLQKVTIEETVLSGTVGTTDFTGYTNYRLFAEVADATDQVTAVIGNSVCSANVTTSTNFYRSPVITSVQPLTDQINPAFFGFAPDLIHSSGLGIGLGAAGTQGIPRDEDTDGDGLGASIGGSSNLVAAQGEEFWNDFQTTGQSFAIDTDNGGSWFTLPGGANALGFGVNNSVFLGSFTTTGDFSYELSVGIQDDTAGSIDYISCDESGIDNLIYPLVGCDDDTANNYDAFVDVSDLSSCTYDISGCIDPEACNYDDDAVVDDGSCDDGPAAGLDCDGNCLAGTAVTLSLYDSFDDGWGGSDGSQAILTIDGVDYTILVGTESFTLCLDLTACTDAIYTQSNFNNWAAENSWDIVDASGSVIASGGNNSGNVGVCPVLGCIDENATNYNAAADTDDGSCVYPCLDNAVVFAASNYYSAEASFTITDCDGNVLASMDPTVSAYDACIVLPAVYSVNLTDSYGDSWTDFDGSSSSLSIDGVSYTIDGVNDDGSSASFQVGACPVYGCTDTTAANYDETATVNETSSTDATDPCTYGVPGCTDDTACNYDSAATADDGNCTYAAAGFDCAGNCLAGSPVTITLTDSYGDTWNGGSLTVNGVVYEQTTTGAASTVTSDIYNVCLDLSTCIEAVYSVGNYYSEHSWSITDDAGVVLASGVGAAATYTSLFGGCVTDCGDDTANNYNADADIIDNDLCTYDVAQGCTDAAACNYDADAVVDDSSCTYAAAGLDCDGNCLEGVAWATTGAYPAEISFVVTDCDGTELFASTGTEGCMPALPATGTVTLSDSYGDGGSEYGGDVLTIGGVVIYNSEVFTDTWSTSLGVCS